MPADRYKRWHSDSDETEENQSLPEMDELEVDYDDEGNTNNRVMKVIVPKRRSQRKIPLVGSLDVTTRSIFLVALCCLLCICIGLVLGLFLVGSPTVETFTTSTVTKSQSAAPLPPAIIPKPTAPPAFVRKSTAPPAFVRKSTTPPTTRKPKYTTPEPPKIHRREFTTATARRFESFLNNKQLNSFVERLNKISYSQIPNYVASTFRYRGLSTKLMEFSANVSRPDENKPNTVELIYTDGKSEVINEPKLSDGSMPYAAYSPVGDVRGAVVYAHKGSIEDFDTLRHYGVNVSGCIVLIRHVTDAEASQVVRAQSAGAIGVLLYPDPEQFRGNGSAYPIGTGLPEDGVIFPNVKRIPGDPSTLKYPSIKHVYRKGNLSATDVLPSIPVQPISFKTAKRIINHLGGSRLPSTWETSYIRSMGKTWATNSPVASLRLRVNNIMEEKKVTNVHAWLPCDDTSKVIHIGAAQGNTGGAAVGLAALLAIGQGLKAAFPDGTGKRIMLSAWAESRQGFIGSTEFTELQHSWLGHSALAYLNIGSRVGVKGGLRVRGSPILHDIVRKSTEKVSWPKYKYMNVIDGWRMGNGKEYDIAFENLGCLSDAVSFAAAVGVPSVQFSVSQPQHPSNCREGYCDVCFDEREEHPLSDSQYDTTEAAMSTVDPDLNWSIAMASMVGNTALVLSESAVPPVNFKGDFSECLVDGWWSFLHHHLNAINSVPYNFLEILEAIRHELYEVQSHMNEVSGWYSQPEPKENSYEAFRHNENRLNFFLQVSRNLLGPRGIDRRFSTTLAGQSDLVESVILTHNHQKEMPYNTTNSTILATGKKKTDKDGKKIDYKNLAFAHFYREEDKQRPHIWFPQVTEALRKALTDDKLLVDFHEELSILLGALKSFKNI